MTQQSDKCEESSAELNDRQPITLRQSPWLKAANIAFLGMFLYVIPSLIREEDWMLAALCSVCCVIFVAAVMQCFHVFSLTAGHIHRRTLVAPDVSYELTSIERVVRRDGPVWILFLDGESLKIPRFTPGLTGFLRELQKRLPPGVVDVD